MSLSPNVLKKWIFSAMDAFGAGVNLKNLTKALVPLLESKAYKSQILSFVEPLIEIAGRNDSRFPEITYASVLPLLNNFKVSIQNSSIPDSGDINGTNYWIPFISQAGAIEQACSGFSEDFQALMSKVLKKYVEEKITIKYSWNGIFVPPPPAAPIPDPTVTFDVKNPNSGSVEINFQLTPELLVPLLGPQVQAAILGSIITLPVGFNSSPSSMVCVAPVPYTPTGIKSSKGNMLDFATKTITSLQSSINPSPLSPSSHSSGPISFTSPPGAGASMVSIL